MIATVTAAQTAYNNAVAALMPHFQTELTVKVETFNEYTRAKIKTSADYFSLVDEHLYGESAYFGGMAAVLIAVAKSNLK